MLPVLVCWSGWFGYPVTCTRTGVYLLFKREIKSVDGKYVPCPCRRLLCKDFYQGHIQMLGVQCDCSVYCFYSSPGLLVKNKLLCMCKCWLAKQNTSFVTYVFAFASDRVFSWVDRTQSGKFHAHALSLLLCKAWSLLVVIQVSGFKWVGNCSILTELAAEWQSSALMFWEAFQKYVYAHLW